MEARAAADGQRGVFATAAFAAGDVIVPFGAADEMDEPGRLTVQVAERRHITLRPPELAFVNHGCEPNVAFDVERRALVAVRDVAVGDELRSYYPATEWHMSHPFRCACGARTCLGEVRGAADLPADVVARGPVAPHVRRLLRTRDDA